MCAACTFAPFEDPKHKPCPGAIYKTAESRDVRRWRRMQKKIQPGCTCEARWNDASNDTGFVFCLHQPNVLCRLWLALACKRSRRPCHPPAACSCAARKQRCCTTLRRACSPSTPRPLHLAHYTSPSTPRPLHLALYTSPTTPRPLHFAHYCSQLGASFPQSKEGVSSPNSNWNAVLCYDDKSV